MSSSDKEAFQRLPTDVVPRNYNVELTPDLIKCSFLGRLDITAEVGDDGLFDNLSIFLSPSLRPSSPLSSSLLEY